ncbi:hypothetical protein GCM10009117_01650 [Gangjinia marincola]|uniref:Uncharacterized protein n=1 Tax=Gangjinia marincola TaxID=578463 RepID=A0ABP3XRR6_9FLAO
MDNLKYIFALLCIGISTLIRGQDLSSSVQNIAQSNDLLGGSVVVFCSEGIIDEVHFGTADVTRNLSVNTNTKFRIASVSKSITAIAVMQLEEEGIISITQDISDLLGFTVRNPSFPDTAITLGMLLSHTSSIIDGSTYGAFLSATVNDDPIPNLSELLSPAGLYYTSDQFNAIEPGTYFNYSNINFGIIATIIERVTDTRFDVYCKEEIFDPLGIDASFNVTDLNDIDDLAVIYRKINGDWEPQVDNFQGTPPTFTNLNNYIPGNNGLRFSPQGGLRISTTDLATIYSSFLKNGLVGDYELLSSDTIDEMFFDHWTFNGSNGNNYFGLFRSWGLGIHRITNTPNNDVVLPLSNSAFGHPGEAYGLVSDAYVDTEQDLGLIFLTNGNGSGYQIDDNSAFYTVEKEIFDAIEDYVDQSSCSTLSTAENTTPETLIPNPVENVLDVSRFPKKWDGISLSIYSLDGKQLLSEEINSAKPLIDVSTLANGIYILQIQNVKLGSILLIKSN